MATLTAGPTSSGIDPRRGIGSEFVGEVSSIGSNVELLEVGDRVIGQMSWPGGGSVRGGVPTEEASREFLELHQDKLMKIPPTMPNDVAAGFALGAQTAYSMVRRLRVEANDRVLVTAATSSTSLFAIRALRQAGVRVFAATSSSHAAPALMAMGVEHIVPLDRDRQMPDLIPLARRIGGFYAVLDPFTDIYLPLVVPSLRYFGQYISCGLSAASYLTAGAQGEAWSRIFPAILERNVTVIANCLGLREDLEDALQDWSNGKSVMTLDSTFSGLDIGAFIDRTYNARDRFGKVVYVYT